MSFAEMEQLDRAAATRDPLGADAFFATTFVELNRNADRAALAEAAAGWAAAARAVIGPTPADALAAVRDLGMIAASLVRRQISLEVAPGLTEALLRWSRITGEVPYATIYAYGPRNPTGPRARLYSGGDGERALVRHFSACVTACTRTLALILDAERLGPAHDDAAPLIHEAARELRAIVAAMITVRATFAPEVVALEIRPYFLQLPLYLIDAIAWSDDVRHPHPAEAGCLPRPLAQLAESRQGVPSMLARARALTRHTPALVRTLEALSVLVANLQRCGYFFGRDSGGTSLLSR